MPFAPRPIARRLLLLSCMMFPAIVSAVPAYADDSSPEALLHSIYDTYTGNPKRAHGVSLNSDAAIMHYFEPMLGAMIVENDHRASKLGAGSVLDAGDIFVDAAAWNIPSVDIKVQPDGTDKAQATVSFSNDGQPMELNISLVKVEGAWRIYNIASKNSGGSLRKVLGTK